MLTIQNAPDKQNNLHFYQRNPRAFALFEDRHKLPDNDGALFTGYDWRKHQGLRNKAVYEKALSELRGGSDVVIYITGLTPALTEFIGEATRMHLDWLTVGLITGGVRVRHYDRETGGYFEQTLFSPQATTEPF